MNVHLYILSIHDIESIFSKQVNRGGKVRLKAASASANGFEIKKNHFSKVVVFFLQNNHLLSAFLHGDVD